MGTGERHRYFNDREKLLKEKDLRIFVAITEKSYFFLFCVLFSPEVPFNVIVRPQKFYKHAVPFVGL